MNLEWMARAACAGSELDFYDFVRQATEGDNGALDEVKFGELVLVCNRCPVIAECAAYALKTSEPYGVWAGTTPRQRQRMDMADNPVQAVIDKAIKNRLIYEAFLLEPQQVTLEEAV